MDKETFDAYVKAGNIAAQARDYGKSLIKVGASLLEVTEAVEKKILELGGDFAFPPQISLNDIAAHYCAGPEDDTKFKQGDIAKLDVGVHINGFVGDTAVTVVLSDDEELKKLEEASREALNAALKIIKPGVTLSEIGAAIHAEITKRGFAPIRNLSGHGLAQFVIHDSPSVPNFDTGSNEELVEDQVIAIEPFASTGAGIIYESSNPTIFSISGKKPVRSTMTREVLKDLEQFNGLPFALRWIVKTHGEGKTKFALRELRTKGILKEYAPLPDKAHGLVSQAEHTVIVRDEPVITTKID
ncbi:MAG: type II methionyl aminopeptidase [Nanoarchaeota archaeon]|nr:type II methionyl aminopeptidase [Nanoarchaeota archaeon]MBU1320964.1 type II methionyl aminopeptidase [Nanoarchaeota archaeon]MBU1598349.1 type II methionyl aminopeptidase [Nanoarchaeota archaeon]MBU2441749.1 type II methionyl aminopeptidase [Nanoarchaeota archaeon]